MKMTGHAFYSGVGVTALVAVMALWLARLPGLAHLGPLTTALLLGLAWRLARPLPAELNAGLAFSARTLLRLGIVLLGVRLNLALVLEAGPRILLLDLTVITAGLVGIMWLGRRLGLEPTLAALIAVDSSICGASAVAAAAPALRARDEETALVIPLCSLIGTAAVLGYTFVQHLHPVSDLHYGLMAGSTLHEIAQVMAAVNPVPAAADIGTVTKLTRVVLLVPAVFVLARWTARRRAAETKTAHQAAPAKPWFVLDFLAVGAVNTLALHLWPEGRGPLTGIDHGILAVANFLMAMAMAAMGLQVDFARLRANGWRTLGTALLGWLALAGLAAAEIALLTR